jgi:hypothetical protein
MKLFTTLLLCVTLGLANATAGFSQQEEPCPVLTPAPQPPCPELKDIGEKFDLWRSGTCLRGANIWQKRVKPDDEMGEGPVGPPYKQEDFCKLAALGANYVNISHPGIFAEKPDARGKYYEQEGIYANLKNLIEMCRKARLFVVVSFRTGPERSEGVFSKDEKPLHKDVWKNKDAREAWARMWGVTAARLQGEGAVIGYDLMVEPGLEREGGTHKDTWNKFAELMRARIRRTDGGNDQRTPILIGTAGAVESLEHPVPPADDRTVYTVHQYVPDEYAQPEEGRATIPYPGGLSKMPSDLQELYNQVAKFKSEHRNVPVAVNEFGAVRYAPRAECYVGLQMELMERLGITHALWLWETSYPINYDQFNFRYGPDPMNHREVETSRLIETIKLNWANNPKDLPTLIEKFTKRP